MNPDMLKNCGNKIKTEKSYANDITNLSEELKIITENIDTLSQELNVTDINLHDSYDVSVYLSDAESTAIKSIVKSALKRERLEKISELQNILDSFTEKLTNEK